MIQLYRWTTRTIMLNWYYFQCFQTHLDSIPYVRPKLPRATFNFPLDYPYNFLFFSTMENAHLGIYYTSPE